jgi:hypothetical protein
MSLRRWDARELLQEQPHRHRADERQPAVRRTRALSCSIRYTRWVPRADDPRELATGSPDG